MDFSRNEVAAVIHSRLPISSSLKAYVIFAVLCISFNICVAADSCAGVSENLDLCGAASKGITISNAGRKSLLKSSSGDALFHFTTTTTRRLTFTTCFPETDLDTVLRLYEVCPIRDEAVDYLAANDDAHRGCPFNTYASELAVEVPQGTYYLLVEGSFFREGTFRLQVTDSSCPSASSESATAKTVPETRVKPAPVEAPVQGLVPGDDKKNNADSDMTDEEREKMWLVHYWAATTTVPTTDPNAPSLNQDVSYSIGSISPLSGPSWTVTTVTVTGSFPETEDIYCVFGDQGQTKATIVKSKATLTCLTPEERVEPREVKLFVIAGYDVIDTYDEEEAKFRFYDPVDPSWAITPSELSFDKRSTVSFAAPAQYFNVKDSITIRANYSPVLVLGQAMPLSKSYEDLPALYDPATGIITVNVGPFDNVPQTLSWEFSGNGQTFEPLSTVVPVRATLYTVILEIGNIPSSSARTYTVSDLVTVVPALTDSTRIKFLQQAAGTNPCTSTTGSDVTVVTADFAILPSKDATQPSAESLARTVAQTLQPAGGIFGQFFNGEVATTPILRQFGPSATVTQVPTKEGDKLTILLDSPVENVVAPLSEKTFSNGFWYSNTFKDAVQQLVGSTNIFGDSKYFFDRAQFRLGPGSDLSLDQVASLEVVFDNGYPGCFQTPLADVTTNLQSFIQLGAKVLGKPVLDAGVHGVWLRPSAVISITVSTDTASLNNKVAGLASASSLPSSSLVAMGLQRAAADLLPATFDRKRIVEAYVDTVTARRRLLASQTRVVLRFVDGADESGLPTAASVKAYLGAKVLSQSTFAGFPVTGVDYSPRTTTTTTTTSSNSISSAMLPVIIATVVCTVALVALIAGFLVYRHKTRSVRKNFKDWSSVDQRGGPFLNDVLVA